MTTLNSPEDPVLLQRITQRDQAALSDLYDRYARILFATSYKILGLREEAEEVVLDVFTQVWRIAGTYNPSRGRVDTWLFLLTRSRSLDRLRSTQRFRRVVEASEAAAQVPLTPSAPGPEEVLLMSERREQVQAALSQIPSEQRQVIEMMYFQGLTQAEIAEQSGIPLGTIKTRLRLGLSKLRQTLQPLHSTKLQ